MPSTAKPMRRAKMLFHISSELLGGGDLEWTHNLSARLLRLGWLFFVLISVSSYTANLAAFFSAYHVQSYVKSMRDADLRNTRICMPARYLDLIATSYPTNTLLAVCPLPCAVHARPTFVVWRVSRTGPRPVRDATSCLIWKFTSKS